MGEPVPDYPRWQMASSHEAASNGAEALGGQTHASPDGGRRALPALATRARNTLAIWDLIAVWAKTPAND
jgi:hypothetical protein